MWYLSRIIEILSFWIKYYLICRADKVRYLKSQGAIIGVGCDLIVSISAFGSEPFLVRLDNNVTVTDGVRFITHDGATRVFRDKNPLWKKGMGVYGSIHVEENVFIGVNSVLLPGIHVGANSIIGAGSVVTKDVPKNVVVAGNPARVLCSIEDYQTRMLEKAIMLMQTKDPGRKKELIEYFWNGED